MPPKLDLFSKQAKIYAKFRPRYPPELFEFLASLTSDHALAWDVGTGNGQASAELVKHYQSVVATDISSQQISFAAHHPRIRYAVTPSVLTLEELQETIAPKDSVDLVTVAQALHWFDFKTFYANVKSVLKKSGGVFAAWGYGTVRVSPEIDALVDALYLASDPYWEPQRRYVDEEYHTIPFDFQPLPGKESLGTSPLRFEATKEANLEEFVGQFATWSATNTALAQGINLLDENFHSNMQRAWGPAETRRMVRWPVFMRVGTC